MWFHADKASNQRDGFQPWHDFPRAAQLGKYFCRLFFSFFNKAKSSDCVFLSEPVVDGHFCRLEDGLTLKRKFYYGYEQGAGESEKPDLKI